MANFGFGLDLFAPAAQENTCTLHLSMAKIT